MFLKLTVVLVSVLLSNIQCDSYDKVLHFPKEFSTENYVLIKPDFSEVQEKLSICSWIKETKDNTAGSSWFSYATAASDNELILFDYLSYVYLFAENRGIGGDHALLNHWQHCCVTWSSARQILRMYINGAVVKSVLVTAPRNLAPDGTLVLGQEQDRRGGGFELRNAFAGEIYQLNVFSRVLTDDEIGTMFRNGRCSYLDRSLLKDVVLGWDDVTTEYRHGAVRVVSPECEKWNWNWDILKDFMGQEVTEQMIGHLKKEHPLY